MSSSSSKPCCIVASPRLVELVDRAPNLRGRASRVFSLLSSCGLLARPNARLIAPRYTVFNGDSSHFFRVKIELNWTLHLSQIQNVARITQIENLTPRPATVDELTRFHSHEYVETLRRCGDRDDDDDDIDEALAEFGLGYDCPVIPELYDFASLVAGSSICAAKCLASGACDVAVNWFGGWHHAQRDAAAGFCYVNDVVLAVHALTASAFPRVLYIDLDVHHGDGVENAFLFTDKVSRFGFPDSEFPDFDLPDFE